MMIKKYQPPDNLAILEIYNYYVANTAFTFDETPATPASWADKFESWQRGDYPCFTAFEQGKLVGFAYGGAFRARAAYRTSAEVTIYLAATNLRRGTGTALYTALLAALSPYHRLLAGITAPNEPSVALHRKFGFTLAGRLNEVGYKFNSYHDVLWYEKRT